MALGDQGSRIAECVDEEGRERDGQHRAGEGRVKGGRRMAGEEDLCHERIRREGELREDERCRRANQMEKTRGQARMTARGLSSCGFYLVEADNKSQMLVKVRTEKAKRHRRIHDKKAILCDIIWVEKGQTPVHRIECIG